MPRKRSAIDISTIIDAEQLQALMDDFFALTNIGVAVADMEDNIIVATGWQDICTQFHRVNEQTKKNCLESDLYLSQEVKKGEYLEYKCKNNMWDIATPIMAGAARIGTLYLGQFFYDDEEVDYDFFAHQAELYNFDKEAYLDALSRAPRWSRERVRTVMRFYSRLASIISELSFNNVQLLHMHREQKRQETLLKEKEENFRALAEHAGMGITVIQDDAIQYCNSTAAEIAGYAIEEMRGINLTAMLDSIHETERKAVSEIYLDQAGNIDIFPPLEYRHIRKDGSVVWVEGYTSAILYNGKPALLVVHNDITKRKRNAEMLQTAVTEKDFLMRELNHRVKNTLAMISSLIELKGASLGPDVDLSDISSQITAIQIVYEKLYKTNNITHIDLREYIQELLSAVFSFHRKSVAIENTVADISIHTQRAVPVGLIVNELATNAIKHGFTAEEPRFTVGLEEDKAEGRYVLTVSNTGNPFPETVTLDNPETLGLRLISALVEQLEGTIDLQRNPRPVFTVRFPVGK